MASLPDLLADRSAAELDELAGVDHQREHALLISQLLQVVAQHEAGEWRHRAACRGEHRRLFHDRRTLKAALTLCSTCPVVQECREWALALPDHLDRVGVAGGLRATERQLLRAEGVRT